jgi:hypothetical protein
MINVNAVWMPTLVYLMIQEVARFMTIRSVMKKKYLFMQN